MIKNFKHCSLSSNTMTYTRLRKTYYERSRSQHPDKVGGSNEKFVALCSAYEYLVKVYDERIAKSNR